MAVSLARQSIFLAARTQQKQEELKVQQQGVREWIEEMVGLDIEADEFLDALQDGVVLCSIANAISPGSIPKVHPAPKLAFKQIENITSFINACKRFGLAPAVLFDPQELQAKKKCKPCFNLFTCII